MTALDTEQDATVLIDAVGRAGQGDRAAALLAVLEVCTRREADPVVRELAAQVMDSAGRPEEAARLRAPVAAQRPQTVRDPALRDMVLRFESLGEDAEFGLVQSHFDAEPSDDLLRWCAVSPDALIRLLECRFEGLGADGATRLDLSAAREWWITDTVHGLTFPTFVREDGGTPDQVLASQSALLRTRAAALVRDIEEAGRIFVMKSITPPPGPMRTRLAAILETYGKSWMLIATQADVLNGRGSIRHLSDRLVIGFIRELAPRTRDDRRPETVCYDDWLDILRRTLVKHEMAPRWEPGAGQASASRTAP